MRHCGVRCWEVSLQDIAGDGHQSWWKRIFFGGGCGEIGRSKRCDGHAILMTHLFCVISLQDDNTTMNKILYVLGFLCCKPYKYISKICRDSKISQFILRIMNDIVFIQMIYICYHISKILHEKFEYFQPHLFSINDHVDSIH